MDCFRRFHSGTDRFQSGTGRISPPIEIPRRVLRHVLLSHNIGVGARVLDLGCGRGGLVRYLNELGIDAIGLDESAEHIDAAEQTAPHLEFQLGGTARQQFDANDRGFDMVLARDLAAYRTDLFAPEAFAVTANLLSCLRPSGCFVFLTLPDFGSHADFNRHSIGCFARHLSFFPGRCRVVESPPALPIDAAWKWLSGRTSNRTDRLASLRVPAQKYSAAQWDDLGAAAGSPVAESCCTGSNGTTRAVVEFV